MAQKGRKDMLVHIIQKNGVKTPVEIEFLERLAREGRLDPDVILEIDGERLRASISPPRKSRFPRKRLPPRRRIPLSLSPRVALTPFSIAPIKKSESLSTA